MTSKLNDEMNFREIQARLMDLVIELSIEKTISPGTIASVMLATGMTIIREAFTEDEYQQFVQIMYDNKDNVQPFSFGLEDAEFDEQEIWAAAIDDARKTIH